MKHILDILDINVIDQVYWIKDHKSDNITNITE